MLHLHRTSEATVSVRLWRTKAISGDNFAIKTFGRLIPVEARVGRCGKIKGLFSFVESYRPWEAVIFYDEGGVEERVACRYLVRTLGEEQIGPYPRVKIE